VNQVTISGQLEADEMGRPWMTLQVSKTWYTSGEMTFTCPEDDYAVTKPLPASSEQEFPLRFEYTDGPSQWRPTWAGCRGSISGFCVSCTRGS
jgi:hypothetical protein